MKFEFPKQKFYVYGAGKGGTAGEYFESKTKALKAARKLRKTCQWVSISSMGVTYYL